MAGHSTATDVFPAGRVRTGLAVVALLATAAGVAWWAFAGGVEPPSGRTSTPNLVLITLDTTRADRLGPYGYSGVQTPVLDRLAAEGVVFDRAITAAPLTLPAHTSIMSGLYPPRHGVRDNGGFFVRDDTVTLAERLREQGYRTGAFVGAYVLDGRWGLNQGFDTYHDHFDVSSVSTPSLAAVERPGNEVADQAIAWLGETAAPPFFAWIHFFDPHSPYRAPEPYGRLYARQPYLGEIAFADAQIGRVVAFLEQRRLLDNSVVVVVGDHGESLGEHGEGTHGFFVYEATTRVPLIIRTAVEQVHTKRVGTVVRTVDVMPTVLELLGLETAAGIDGRSLVPLMRGEAQDLGLRAYSEAFYPRLHFGWSELLALHAGSLKVHRRTPARSLRPRGRPGRDGQPVRAPPVREQRGAGFAQDVGPARARGGSDPSRHGRRHPPSSHRAGLRVQPRGSPHQRDRPS